VTEFSAVREVLTTLFDGLHYCDTQKLAAVFHPKAVYATADESPLLHRTMDEYFAVVEERQSPASLGEVRRDHIDSISFLGSNTAFARVRCSIGSRDFVDFLTLVRTDDGWRIMSKVFHIVPKQAGAH
jgi:hypothetical protein